MYIGYWTLNKYYYLLHSKPYRDTQAILVLYTLYVRYGEYSTDLDVIKQASYQINYTRDISQYKYNINFGLFVTHDQTTPMLHRRTLNIVTSSLTYC